MSLNSTNFDFDHRYDPLVFDDYYTQLFYETYMLHTFEECSCDFNCHLENPVKTQDQDGESSLPPEIFTTFAPIIGQPPAELIADEATVQPTSKKRHIDTSVEREFNKRRRPNREAEDISTITKKILKSFESEKTDSLSLEANSSETSSPYEDPSQRVEVFSTPKVFSFTSIQPVFPLGMKVYNQTRKKFKELDLESKRKLNIDYARKSRKLQKEVLEANIQFIKMTKTELTQMFGRLRVLNDRIVSHPKINSSILVKTSDIWTESQNKMQEYNKLIESEIEEINGKPSESLKTKKEKNRFYSSINRQRKKANKELTKIKKVASEELKVNFEQKLRVLEQIHNTLN